MLLHACVAVQYQLLGHVNLIPLQYLGDLGLIAAATLLWFFVKRAEQRPAHQVWLYVLCCLLFLAPRYFRVVNWAMAGLQNLCVLPFALGTFLCVARVGRGWRVLSLACVAMSIATSGNGFFVALICMAFLLTRREYKAAMGVVLVIGLMAVPYAWHYQSVAVGTAMSPLRTVFAFLGAMFAFLGAGIGRAKPALLIGAILLAGYVYLARRQWHREDPAAFLTATFCVVTAAAVAFTRHSLGWAAGAAERYGMYSLLLAALEMLCLVRLFGFGNGWLRSGRGRILLVSSLVLLVVFNLYWNWQAERTLSVRKTLLIIHLIRWEREPQRLLLIPDDGSTTSSPGWEAMRFRFQRELAEDISMGLYVPPELAGDPVPATPAVIPKLD